MFLKYVRTLQTLIIKRWHTIWLLLLFRCLKVWCNLPPSKINKLLCLLIFPFVYLFQLFFSLFHGRESFSPSSKSFGMRYTEHTPTKTCLKEKVKKATYVPFLFIHILKCLCALFLMRCLVHRLFLVRYLNITF